MKTRFVIVFLYLTALVGCNNNHAPLAHIESGQDIGEYSFFIVADVGRNGYFKQMDVAYHMGEYAELFSPEFILSAGDCFHMRGVQSIHDPIFLSNFEHIYTHPRLHCEWYSVLGNHEYQGNTQAVIDYSDISRRWVMPDRYYTNSFVVNDSVSVRIVHIDTSPVIEKYRKDSTKYFDAWKQDHNRQIVWLDSVLSVSDETWKIVIGHHPIVSEDTKSTSEKKELMERVNPLLEKYQVDYYFSGHIHTFQHLQTGNNIEYVVVPSGSLGRPALRNQHTLFSSEDEGFIICDIFGNRFNFRVVNYNGDIIYSHTRTR